MTPTWLVDESGRVVAGYAADYLVRLGRVRDEEQLARDRADAFANVAPSFDQNSDGECLARVPGGFETTAPEHRCLNVACVLPSIWKAMSFASGPTLMIDGCAPVQSRNSLASLMISPSNAWR